MIEQSKTLTQFLEMVRREKFYVLDTETTGLRVGEIVQIAIIDHTGNEVLNTLVKPVFAIPPDATNVHGITDEMVSSAPGWNVIAPQVREIIEGRDLIVYNAVYDRKMMHQSDEHWSSVRTNWRELCRWHCAMEAYAEHFGDWNSWHNSYRWQSLTNAMFQQNLPTQEAHTALGDCLMTLALVRKIAGL
jgi:DNA polymerase-3 subunit epsilon